MQGWKFARQVPIGPFIVDFAARRERLAIELDGDSHATQADYDERRTAFLESKGWKVVRFANTDIVRNPEGVALTILERLNSAAHSPQPSPQRGEGVGN
jgi:very-short-patch-repair endonuclease